MAKQDLSPAPGGDTQGVPNAGPTLPAELLFDWQRNARTLMLGNLLANIGFTIYFPYIPLMLEEMGAGENLSMWVGVYTGLLFLTTMVMQPIWGGVADYYGKKPMLLRAGFGMGLVFTAMAFTPHLLPFLALVVVLGLCNGYIPSSLALVVANTPPRSMGRALSTVQGGSLIGSTVGPALGGLLAILLPSYRHLLFFGAAACFMAGVLALVAVREQHVRPPAPFRLNLWQDLRTCLAVPNMGLLYFLLYAFAVTFFGSVPIISLYTRELLTPDNAMGLTEDLWLGIVAVALMLASAMALPVWGRVLDRLEPRRVLLIGLAACLACLLPLLLLTTPLQLTLARAALGLLGIGIQPASVHLTKTLSPPGMDARALGFGIALIMLGLGTAPLLAGAVQPLVGLRGYFAGNAALITLALALWLWRGVRRNDGQTVAA